MRLRRSVLVALSVVLAALAFPVRGNPISDATGADVLVSDNVELVTTVPEPGAIGARFRGSYMYVTTTTGLAVYDVSDPRSPELAGRLPLPHFENEDVDLGGSILLISNDAAESRGILHVVSIDDPTAPELLTSFDMGGNPVQGGPGHTASCVLDCSFAWVTDNGGILVVDLRNPAAPVAVGTFPTPAAGDLGVTHDVQVDGDGVAWVAGYGGTAGYRLPSGYDGRGLGEQVAFIDAESAYASHFGTSGLVPGVTPDDSPNDFIHHNSLRRAGGDVVYVTEEDYARPGCRGAGSFQTWQIAVDEAGQPTGERFELLDTWTTELAADTASPSAMCSAHYFDEDDGLVAQAWYQQGVRFLDVTDPGDIRQVGYWIPPTALAWAAYFAPADPSGETVYALDYTRGIDVLAVDRPEPDRGPHCGPRGRHAKTPNSRHCRDTNGATRSAPVRPEWLQPAALPAGLSADRRFGFGCLVPSPSAVQ